jgi:hypothetical protein
LPSAVAFTSLVSAAGVPSAAAYGLISLGRLLGATDQVKPAWSLGRWSKLFQAISVVWNGWVVAVLYSPYEFPVDASTLNCKLSHSQEYKRSFKADVIQDAPIIMAIVTIFALFSWFLTPASIWLPLGRVSQ